MKTLFRLLMFAALGLLALAACAPNAAAPAASTSGSQIVGSEGGLYPPQDLSLVANTGKPQFLDSYADW